MSNGHPKQGSLEACTRTSWRVAGYARTRNWHVEVCKRTSQCARKEKPACRVVRKEEPGGAAGYAWRIQQARWSIIAQAGACTRRIQRIKACARRSHLSGETQWFALSILWAEGKGEAAFPVMISTWLGREIPSLGRRRRVGRRILCWAQLELVEGSRPLG